MDSFLGSQLIHGKLILDGEDISGFSVIGNSQDLSEDDCKEIVKQTYSGQIGDLDKFAAVFGLTETDGSKNRIFFGIFKSKVIDKKRGAFPVRHVVILSNEVVNKVGIVRLAQQMGKPDINRQFSQKETLSPLAIECIESEQKSYETEDCFSEYSNSILKIVDALFLFSSVIVITDNFDPFFRLCIISAIYSLLPPSLKSKLSFNTNVYDPINLSKFRLKFISQRPTESDYNSIRISLKKNSTNTADIKTEYAVYIGKLLQNDVPFNNIVRHCQGISVDGIFSKEGSLYFSNVLKNSIQPELFIARIKSGEGVKAIEVLELLSKQGISIKEEDLAIYWNSIFSSVLQGQHDLIKLFPPSVHNLPGSFWDNIAEKLIKQNDTTSVLSFFEALGDLNSRMIMSNQEPLLKSWIDNFIDTASTDSLLSIMHSNFIIDLISQNTLVKILNGIIHSNSLHPSQLESFLDFLLQRKDSIALLQQSILLGLSYELTKLYPLLSCFLSSIASQSNLFSNQIEDSIQRLKREMLNQPKIIIYLGVLGMRAKQIFPLSPVYLEFIITQESFSQIFSNELSKTDLKPLLLNIQPECLGALIAFSLINRLTIIDDITPKSMFEKWTIETKTRFIKGFVQLARKTQKYQQIYIALSQYLEDSAKYQALILVAENVRATQIRSDILSEVISLLEDPHSKIDDVDVWGSKIIELTKTSTTTTRNNVYRLCLRSYLGSTSEKFIEGLNFIVSKQCLYEDLLQIMKDSIRQSSCSDEQIAKLWYDLFLFVRASKKSIFRNYSDELLKQQIPSLLADEELEILMGIQEVSRVDTPIYKESLRRTIGNSLFLFIQRISTDFQNGKVDMKGLSDLLSDIWKPLNSNDIRDMLSGLDNNGLSELADQIRLNYVRQNSMDMSVELFEAEFKKLEQKTRVICNLANALSQNSKAVEALQDQIKGLVKKIDNLLKNSELNDARHRLDMACKSKSLKSTWAAFNWLRK